MKRRSLLSLIAGTLILSSSIVQVAAYPLTRLEQAREKILLSYEEWKDYELKPKYPRTDKDLEDFVNADKALKTKVSRMLSNGNFTYGLLTKKEKDSLKSEFNLFEPGDIAEFNAKYNLKLSYEEFKRNRGARVLWYLDREYDYRYTEEKKANNFKR